MGNSNSKKRNGASCSGVANRERKPGIESPKANQKSAQRTGSSATMNLMDGSHGKGEVRRSLLNIGKGTSKRGERRLGSREPSAREFMESLSKMNPEDVSRIMKECDNDAKGNSPHRDLPNQIIIIQTTVNNPKRNSYRSKAA